MPASASAMTYAELADEFRHECEAADESLRKKEAREAVILVVRQLNLLQTVSDTDWREDGIYTLGHEGYSFDKLLGVWMDERQPRYRMPADAVINLTIGSVETTFELRGVADGSFGQGGKKIISNFSYAPTRFGTEFPSLIYNQHRSLLKAAMMKNMGSYTRRDPMRGARPPWEQIYAEEMRRAMRRISPLPGPETVGPFMGGDKDDYGGSGGYGYGYGLGRFR